MKNLISIIGFILFILVSCSDDCIDSEIIEPINFDEVTTSILDKKRLCMGEIICSLFGSTQFLNIIKENSLTSNKNNNKEFFLLEFIKIIEADKELYDLFKAKFLGKTSQCFDNDNEFIQALYNDPGLVIKLPDIYDAHKWNTKDQIPFLYVSTVNPVLKYKTNNQGFYGFHLSGITDFVIGSDFKYFPLVLKYTEDYILLDNQFRQPSGMSLDNYYYNLDWPSLNQVKSVTKINTSNKEYSVFHATDLTNAILEYNGMLEEVPSENVNCDSICLYSCIPKEKRKLFIDSITVISDGNSDLLGHLFNSFLRINSIMILSENLWPLISISSSGNKQKYILGSFRVSDIVNFENQYTISQEPRVINGISYSLSKVKNTIEKLKVNPKKLKPVLISEGFEFSTLFNFSSNIVFNDQVTDELLSDQVSDTYIRTFIPQSRLNYQPFCFELNKGIGSNGIGFTCKY